MSQLTLENQVVTQFELSTCIQQQANILAPEIRVDSDPDADFGTFYLLWHGTDLLGTFYHALDGFWVAQPCNSDDRPRCNTAVEAQLLIMASENDELRRQLKGL